MSAERPPEATRRDRRRALALCLLFFGVGVLIFFFSSPWPLIRGHGGDVVVVAFLYFGAGVIWPTRRRARALAVGALAFGIELFQTLGVTSPDDSALVQATVGSTYDPWDLVAYTLGLALALALDRPRG